ncbi:hypothetical protein PG994_002278 [Apiospora phragmitis]|uniref:Uncharacterized protein n=1 Tax=Apiospora phragmitis TaxID=2905665 RepID=A0ABR1WVZ5_9PEZI
MTTCRARPPGGARPEIHGVEVADMLKINAPGLTYREKNTSAAHEKNVQATWEAWLILNGRNGRQTAQTLCLLL